MSNVSRLVRYHAPSDLEVRSDRRTVHGLVVPFGEVADIHEYGRTYRERFVRGAFERTIRERGERTKLLTSHDGHNRLPIGRAVELREDAAGLFGAFRVSQTQTGDEVLELVRDGALDSFSIGFRPVRERSAHDPSGPVVERTEVALREVSVVTFPAYAGAQIAGVRAEPFLTADEARRRVAVARMR